MLIGYAAVRLRAVLLPGWSFAPARMIEVVLGLSLLTVELQLIGSVGLLDFVPIVVGAGVIAAAAHFLIHPPEEAARKREEAKRLEPDLGPWWFTAGAAAVAVLVAAHWGTGIQASWANGMSGFDTMWYHMPFAARFAQQGSIDALHFTDPEYLHWFYPQNSELLHASGIVLFDRDILSPLINLGWLALALLAAWNIGRPYGAAPLSLLAVAVVLDTNTMVPREAGNAANDIAPIALLLVAAAVLLTAEARARRSTAPGRGAEEAGYAASERAALTAPGVLVCAGMAMGLAIGTKLTMAAALAALTVGIIVVALPRNRLRVAVTWFLAMFLTGGFWFARNMFHASGNPFPWLAHNFHFLPGPERGLEGRDPFSIAHYLFKADGGVVHTYFLSGLHGVMGPLWPVILALAAGGMVAGMLRGRTPGVRLLAAVAAVAAVGYVFTPLSASGPDGHPDGFKINLRYAVPALALGLALLPLDRWFERRARQYGAAAVMLLVLASVALFSDSKAAYQAAAASVPGALVIGLVLLAPLGLAILWQSHPRAAIGVAIGVALVAFIGGWVRQDNYLDARYSGENRYGLEVAFHVTNDLSGQRIGLGGTSAAFQQYGFSGRDASNHVQFIGRPGEDGDFRRILDCAAYREAANAGEYDYLVTAPDLDLNQSGKTLPAPEGDWIRTDPAVRLVGRNGQVSIFKVNGPLDPSGCTAAR